MLTSIKRNLGQQNIGNRQAFVGFRALDTGSALKKAFPSQTLRGRGEYFGFQVTGPDRRTSILGGLEFSIPGFFRVGKFGKYFSFLVGRIRVGFFFRGGGGGGEGEVFKSI